MLHEDALVGYLAVATDVVVAPVRHDRGPSHARVRVQPTHARLAMGAGGDRLAWRPVTASDTGGWVRRVGASGGGKTYRRRRPINFYGVIGLVVVLGLASVSWARYEYRHHTASAATAVAPVVNQQPPWYAALGVDACGSQLPALPANPIAATTGFQAVKGGAIEIEPKAASQAGTNATLARFVDAYEGLTVTNKELSVPYTSGNRISAKTYTAGEACPKGTPDAGKIGEIEIAVWPNFDATSPTIYSKTSSVRFSSNQLITFAFVPMGTTPPKPPALAIKTMFNPPTTTTTTTTSTSTTIPATPTTKG